MVGLEWYPCCGLQLVFYPSTITVMHGPINIIYTDYSLGKFIN